MTQTLHQIKSEQTRSKLLDAAIELMHAPGFRQISVHDVARAAGMTSGAVQHHFETKAALMVQVLIRIIQRFEAGANFWPETDWPVERRAKHFVQSSWEQFYGVPRFALAWSSYLSTFDDPTLVAHIRAKRSEVADYLTSKMAECFPEMYNAPDGEARIQIILSAMRGIAISAPFSDAASTQPQLDAVVTLIESYSQHAITTDSREVSRRTPLHNAAQISA